MAALFGLTSDEAADGVPIARISAAVHPEDRARSRHKREVMLSRGGLFVIEYRVGAEHQTRWVLARGRYERDATGQMNGRGIVIDITESKLDGHVEDRAYFLAANEDGVAAEQPPLDAAATHAIAARRAIDELGVRDRDWAVLRKAVDALLWALGRALARRG